MAAHTLQSQQRRRRQCGLHSGTETRSEDRTVGRREERTGAWEKTLTGVCYLHCKSLKLRAEGAAAGLAVIFL